MAISATATTVPNVTLNNGIQMPILGFGVYQITDLDECERSVLTALETGYRHIDTATAYGNEQAVGSAIAKSGVAREDIFITSKLWVSHFSEEKAYEGVNESLDRLGVDYVDLYLLHQPFGDVHGAWRGLEKAYKEGKVKAIGVSNFHQDRVMDMIVTDEIAPAVNQIEINPFYQRAEDQKFMEDNHVQTESWASFAEGRNGLFTHPVLQAIGDDYGKSVAQVVLRWLVQRNIVVIPKSVTKERIIENFDIFDFELSSDDMQKIAALDKNETSFFSHRDPLWVERIMSRR